MIVIADTTPINYLILIGEIDVLAALYGHVVIPAAVYEELRSELAPSEVRAWIEQPRDWLAVRTRAQARYSGPSKLDTGERDAIDLAEELAADQLIIDELYGRREAERRGLSVIGTMGVLRDAASAGLLDLTNAIERLRHTSAQTKRLRELQKL
jgi:predicted nucleic acid-binding protein